MWIMLIKLFHFVRIQYFKAPVKSSSILFLNIWDDIKSNYNLVLQSGTDFEKTVSQMFRQLTEKWSINIITNDI